MYVNVQAACCPAAQGRLLETKSLRTVALGAEPVFPLLTVQYPLSTSLAPAERRTSEIPSPRPTDPIEYDARKESKVRVVARSASSPSRARIAQDCRPLSATSPRLTLQDPLFFWREGRHTT